MRTMLLNVWRGARSIQNPALRVVATLWAVVAIVVAFCVVPIVRLVRQALARSLGCCKYGDYSYHDTCHHVEDATHPYWTH